MLSIAISICLGIFTSDESAMEREVKVTSTDVGRVNQESIKLLALAQFLLQNLHEVGPDFSPEKMITDC